MSIVKVERAINWVDIGGNVGDSSITQDMVKVKALTMTAMFTLIMKTKLMLIMTIMIITSSKALSTLLLLMLILSMVFFE